MIYLLVNTFYYRIVSYIDLFLRDEQTNGNGWHRAEAIRLEQDIFTALAGQGKLYVYKTPAIWSQIKSAGWVGRLNLLNNLCGQWDLKMLE